MRLTCQQLTYPLMVKSQFKNFVIVIFIIGYFINFTRI